MTRNELLQRLAERGDLGPARHHGRAPGARLRRAMRAVHLPVTERLSSVQLILPLFHQLTRDEQDQVISAMFDAAGLPSPAGQGAAASAAC